LPWNEYSKDNFDLKELKNIRQRSFGLEDVKKE
jgi:ATP-dependent Lon protease